MRELDAQHMKKQSIKEIPLCFQCKAATPVSVSTGAALYTTLTSRKQPPLAVHKRRTQVAPMISYESVFLKYVSNAFCATVLKMTAEKYLNCAASAKTPCQVSGKQSNYERNDEVFDQLTSETATEC